MWNSSMADDKGCSSSSVVGAWVQEIGTLRNNNANLGLDELFGSAQSTETDLEV
jgi:hypothetical protein